MRPPRKAVCRHAGLAMARRWAAAPFARVAVATTLTAFPALAGTIAGRVQDADGFAVPGVVVTVEGHPATAVSDGNGRYLLADLEGGAYRIRLSLGDRYREVPDVAVPAEGVMEVETTVDWPGIFAERLTVRAASRYAQRIVEAPAAVTTVTAEEVARRSPLGQVPRVLSHSASAELAQSGLFDFNLNTRGFNGSTNRRVLTLLDGRDPSQAVFSGAQEWAALSFDLDEIESIELVRGPGAALYGAGAYNGVLDLRTRAAGESLGGRARLTAGELSTRRVDARYAGGTEGFGYLRATAGYQESGDFLRSRVEGSEYGEGELPAEVVDPPLDEVTLWSAALRYDRDLSSALSLVVEGGTGRIEGSAVLTGVGRLQRRDVERPWARADLATPRWSLLASYTGRDSDGEVSLSSGAPIYLDSYRGSIEAQANGSFAEGRGRLVGGASWTRLDVDSADPSGRQTIFQESVESEHEAVFGQGEYRLGDRWLAVLSLRWDESDLHDARWSPRGALVYSLTDTQTLRLTYSEAFQSPTLSEKNVRVAVAPPLDLSGLEDALAPLLEGVPLGLEVVPLLAVGSGTLEAEEVSTWELGYTGVLGNRTFVTVSAYRSELSNFTTNLIPTLGTSLGQLVFPPLWQPPAALSPEAAALVLAALEAALPPTFLVAAAPDGSPYVPLLSFGSFGEVDTEGFEAGLGTAIGQWRIEGGLSWFDHEVQAAAAEHPLAPNRAEWQAAFGVGWTGERVDAAVDWRWSDGFDYRSGIFVGFVPAYSVVDLTASVRLREGMRLGLAVANALDDEHWEAFGGDVLGRRALGWASYSW